MSARDLNLARAPFVNRRSVWIASAVVWTAAVLLLALNVRTYWRHFTGENRSQQQVQELSSATRAEEERLRELRQRLAALDIGELNARSEFVNERIRQRAFSWSVLFDRVATVLPDGVRLKSLTPDFGAGPQRQRERRGTLEPGEVQLEIEGAARTGEDILGFIDKLFAHPAFRVPVIERETRDEQSGTMEFSLGVIYRPAAEDGGGEGEEKPEAEVQATEETGGAAAAEELS